MNLSYDNLVPSFVAAVPEAQGILDRIATDFGDEHPSPHLVFGVMNELLISGLRESVANARFLSEYFAFLELMASSPDVFVADVVKVTVCERLGDEPADLARALAMMGPRTRDLSLQIEKELGRAP
jgi:hypothetical protein